jgi:F0F1-type ATP synthase assembly protein I
MRPKQPTSRNLTQSLALGVVAGQAGCLMVALVLGGLITGIWLDAQLGTRPLMTLALMLAGVVLGPLAAVTSVLRASHTLEAGEASGTSQAEQEDNPKREGAS